LRTTGHAADGDYRGFDQQCRCRRAAAGSRNGKYAGEQPRLNAAQRTHLDGDPLDRTCSAAGRDLGDLSQQGLAD
jgi:hypothetical protein